MIDIVYRYDPDRPAKDKLPASAAEARELLERGNETFAHILDPLPDGEHPVRIIPIAAGDIGMLRPGESIIDQKPFAIVVGCADARVPIELVFGQGANDIFVLRVAGNVLGEEVLGSIDFALHRLSVSVRLVVVLGHSSCGAVTAAVDAFLDPANYLALAAHHHLRTIVNQIFPAVRIGHEAILNAHGGDARFQPGFRKALIETSVPVNAAMVASALRHQVTSVGATDVEVVFGVYDLETRHVGLPGYDSADKRGHVLLEPPADAAAFASLAALLAGSPRISKLLTR